MSVKPSFAVAVVGLDPEHLRLIAIVFRHIQHNRYLFRLVSPDTLDTADVLIARVSDADGRAALDRARLLRRPRASIGVVAAGDAAPGRHAIEIGQLVRQLLPILNRVVEIEGLVRRITEPVTDGAPASPAGAAASGTTSPGEGDASQRAASDAPRVLVIDDNPATEHELADSLATLGCRIEGVRTGSAALDRLAAGGVDLATLDVELPDGDGLKLARTIRSEPRWRALPLVVLTDRCSAFDVIRGAWAGCSAYLAKPVDGVVMRRTIERQLARVRAAGASVPAPPRSDRAGA